MYLQCLKKSESSVKLLAAWFSGKQPVEGTLGFKDCRKCSRIPPEALIFIFRKMLSSYCLPTGWLQSSLLLLLIGFLVMKIKNYEFPNSHVNIIQIYIYIFKSNVLTSVFPSYSKWSLTLSLNDTGFWEILIIRIS